MLYLNLSHKTPIPISGETNYEAYRSAKSISTVQYQSAKKKIATIQFLFIIHGIIMRTIRPVQGYIFADIY